MPCLGKKASTSASVDSGESSAWIAAFRLVVTPGQEFGPRSAQPAEEARKQSTQANAIASRAVEPVCIRRSTVARAYRGT